MLGQASAIKVRNQVSEYPPLLKLAGCFLCTVVLAAKMRNITIFAMWNREGFWPRITFFEKSSDFG